jgi:hypothetical protein
MALLSKRRPRRMLALLAAAALAGGGVVASVAVNAQAAVQTLPVAAAFNAPECAGTTDLDPTAAGSPVSDLSKVFGQRLADYNNGQVVVLYDAFGANDNDGYPALCGTRYVAGTGAVSEWMFCTDIHSHVCSGTDAEGNLVDVDGTVIPGLDPKTGNPKLTTDQEKLIAYLIQNGHSYQGSGYYDFGAANAVKDQTSKQRASLQVLVWCISDPVASGTSVQSELDRQATCEDNMDAAEQARLLSLIPDVPTVALSFADSGTTLEVGDTASFELTTNLYNQPITLATTGVAGNLAVVSGPATITGTTLTVAGANPAVSTTIKLGFTATTSGQVNVAASAMPASISHIGWNQSPGVATDAKPCQVFATFNEVNQLVVSANADATFGLAPTTDAPTTAPTTDAPTTAPTTDAPTTAPTTDAPTTAPTTDAPTTAPTTDAPTTAPTTDAPTTAPTTDAPTTAPTTDAPTTAAPTTPAGATPAGTMPTAAQTANDLAYTGATGSTVLIIGALLMAGVGIALVASRRSSRKHS